jgi:hypothetical protein
MFLVGVGAFGSAVMSFGAFGVSRCASGRNGLRGTAWLSFLNIRFEAAACNDVNGIFSLPFTLCGRGSNAGIIKSCKDTEEETSVLTTLCFLEVENESSCMCTSFREYTVWISEENTRLTTSGHWAFRFPDEEDGLDEAIDPVSKLDAAGSKLNGVTLP